MPGLTGGMGGGMGMAGGMGGAGAGGAGGFDPAAFDPSKFGAGSAGWQEMTNAAQSMMKDFLQPEKIKELSQNPEVLEIQKDPKMQEIIKVRGASREPPAACRLLARAAARRGLMNLPEASRLSGAIIGSGCR